MGEKTTHMRSTLERKVEKRRRLVNQNVPKNAAFSVKAARFSRFFRAKPLQYPGCGTAGTVVARTGSPLKKGSDPLAGLIFPA
jgi:hypothetical protein